MQRRKEMNEAQLKYEKVFYALHNKGSEVLNWTEEECYDSMLELAYSIRRNRHNPSGLSDSNMSKDEKLEIIYKIITDVESALFELR